VNRIIPAIFIKARPSRVLNSNPEEEAIRAAAIVWFRATALRRIRPNQSAERNHFAIVIDAR